MSEEEDEKILKVLRTFIIPVAALELKDMADEFKTRSLEEFYDFVTHLEKKSNARICEEFKIKKVQELNANIQTQYAYSLVVQFNGALPIDYPYVVIALTFEDIPNKLMVATMVRKYIKAKLHEAIHTEILVCAAISSKADYDSGVYTMKLRLVAPKDDDLEEPSPGL